MTAASQRRRGQPIVALGLIIAAWIGMRAVTWTPLAHIVPTRLVEAAGRTVRTVAATLPSAPPPAEPGGSDDEARPLANWPAVPALPAAPGPARVTVDAPPALPSPNALPDDDVASAHQLMWMAAVAQMPLPATVSRPASLASVPPPQPGAQSPARWSGDGWLFLRGDGPAIASGPASPSYGASQLGAVLRYRLLPADPHQPTVYARAASALAQRRQKEAALGLSARPLTRVPIAVMAEARVTDDAAGARVRPAAMLVSQLAPFRIPGGLDGELYAQAGYVAGRDATVFGDVQARITRRVVQRGRVMLDLGGGAWAGGQRGAARLDVGPTASLSMPLGPGSARVAADWRLRVAGDARPGSGPALTISAGF